MNHANVSDVLLKSLSALWNTEYTAICFCFDGYQLFFIVEYICQTNAKQPEHCLT